MADKEPVAEKLPSNADHAAPTPWAEARRRLAEGQWYWLATAGDILDYQLREVDLNQADLIIVATASDLEGRVPLDTYRANLHALVRALPPEKTVVSDLPLEPGRDAYQAVFQQVVDARGLKRADFAHVFRGEGRRLDIFSWLFPHLNSRGYY